MSNKWWGRGRGRAGDFDISNKQGEGLGKVEIEVFLTKWEKNGETNKWWMLIWHTRVGFSVQNQTGKLRCNFVERFICLEPIFIPNLFYFFY